VPEPAPEPAPETVERSPEFPHAVLPIERAAAALEVILCSGFPTQLIIISILMTFGVKGRLPDGTLSPAFVFSLTLLDTLLLVGLVVFFFRAHRESAREALFGHRATVPEILFGIALIPASFFIVVFVLVVIQLAIPVLRNVPHNPLQDLARTKLEAVLFGFVVMVAGGIREEVQRAFVLRRFEQYLGGGVVGLLLFSVLFGLGHLEQGHDVAIATAALGAFWGAIYLRRRSIIGPMIGHAGFNLAQVVKFVTLRG
jgi:CAAX protease family protein